MKRSVSLFYSNSLLIEFRLCLLNFESCCCLDVRCRCKVVVGVVETTSQSLEGSQVLPSRKKVTKELKYYFDNNNFIKDFHGRVYPELSALIKSLRGFAHQ